MRGMPRFRTSPDFYQPTRRRAPVTLEATPDGSVQLAPSDLPTWQQYITDFDNAIGQVQANLAQLQSMPAPTDAAGYATWQQLISDGASWLSKLQSLQSMRDSVASWTSGLVSSAESAYDTAVDWVSRDVIEPVANALNGPRPSSQLGVLPLIIAGIGLAAFAAVVYGALQWVNQAQRFAQVNAMAKAAIDRGADPTAAYKQAAATVNATAGAPSSGSLFENLGNKLIWGGVIVAIIWVVLPRLLPSRGGA